MRSARTLPLPAPAAAPRFTMIEGRMAQIVAQRPLIPHTLDALLRELRGVTRQQVILAGTRSDCGDGRHRLARWLDGTYGQLELRLALCLDCETVEVRDVSVDRVSVLASRLAPRRRDALLGWYTGKRRAGRVYL